MILVDTRERKWDHIRTKWEASGVEFEVRKLDYGDYMVPGGSVSVDRKQNLDELAANLCTKDARRFWNEIRNAKKHGIQIVVLCEHSRNVKEPRDVLEWRSEHSRITGERLFRAMFEASAAYGVRFLFTDKRHTQKKILQVLGVNDGRLDKALQTNNGERGALE